LRTPGLRFQNEDKKHFALLLTGPNGRSAQVLLTLAIPGHLVFIYAIYLIQGSPDPPTAVFIFFYLAAAFTQVFLLLGIVDVMVHCLWKCGRDPDSFSIPYLTALGDLLGTGFLTLCFLLMSLVT
ncbi:solute carrier family 41 member 2-like, partial [Sinocyclocheilus rhinocerous]|uniref:solute carrier family 41 member 2-like n=1 Tax=Sinocyclocheilus rhinocerous TaxID=307959 RepID=UPI0007B7D8EE